MSKVILITGSTDGIGKLAAVKLVKAGHQVYLHGRSAEKLAQVIDQIEVETGKKDISGFCADLGDLDAVKQMASHINHKLPVVDVLINNAGVFKSKHPVTTDGKDLRFVVNYLAPVLLTHLLLPSIKKSNDGRIINLSSAAQAPVSLDSLRGVHSLSEQDAYAQSKLAILMWSFYLASKEPSLSVTALNPGSLLNTKMVQEAYGRFWSDAGKGADIICDLASQAAPKTGQYFDNDRGDYNQAHPDAYNEEAIAKLIACTQELIGEI